MTMFVKEITFGVRPQTGVELELIVSMKKENEIWLVPMAYVNPNWSVDGKGLKPEEERIFVEEKDCYRVLQGTIVEETGKSLNFSTEEREEIKNEIFSEISVELLTATREREADMFRFFSISIEEFEAMSEEEKEAFEEIMTPF